MSKKNDYYTTISKKVIDFTIGFFIASVLGFIGFTATIQYGNIFPRFFNFGIIGITFLVLLIAAVIYIMKIKGRRYLGIGLIAPIILLALMFGSCIAIFGSL